MVCGVCGVWCVVCAVCSVCRVPWDLCASYANNPVTTSYSPSPFFSLRYTLRNRFDTEVGAGGADAWQWFEEGHGDPPTAKADGTVENHSFGLASKLGLFYKFIFNDEYTMARIALTVKLLGFEIEMPSVLATYWVKRGWKGVDDPTGRMWDRISYIGPYNGPSWSNSIWHYPVFKVTDTTITNAATGAYTLSKNADHFPNYERALNCKCLSSDAGMGTR